MRRASGAIAACIPDMVGAPATRIGMLGAIGTLVGIVSSGPVAVAIVSATHPQPSWADARLFAANYHPLQLLPYAGGLFLVVGLLIVVASAHSLATEASRPLTSLGMLLASVFATMIFANYTIQSAFVPVLVRDASPGNAALIAALSMSNPRSLAWALEMWGWGFCGAATWCISSVFDSRALRSVSLANAIVSFVGAALTSAFPGWVLSRSGMVAFVAWNVLLAVLALQWLSAFRQRRERPEASLVRETEPA